MSLFKKISFLALILSAALLYPLPSRAAAAAPQQSTVKDRIRLELTVYNDNFAFIRDVREIYLKAGTGSLKFTGVPSTVLPDTMLFRPIGKESGLAVLKQSFHYDVPNEKTLLDRYVGKKIRLEVRNRFNDRVSSTDATLLAASPGPVYKIGEEVYIGHHGVPVLPKLPEGLVARPEINLRYLAEKDATYCLEGSYLAKNISWKALYRLVLTENGTQMRGHLTGWVNLTNESGRAFKDAAVRFTAGSPHQAARPYRAKAIGGPQKMVFSYTERASESRLFEYHIYDLGRRIDIKNGEQSQLSLMEARDIEVQKEFELLGKSSYFTRPLRREKQDEPVNVYLKLANSKANHLGRPLPAGIIGMYMESGVEGLEFIGEDNIGHTPAGNEVRLNAGAAFDIRARRIQKEYRRISSVLYNTAWEIKLKNNKAQKVTVNIIEPVSGSWNIITSSHPYTKIGAFKIKFKVDVPAGEEVTVRYKARVEL